MTKITKKELQELYTNNSNDYVCEKLGISITTLIKYLKQNNIPLKGKGNNTKTKLEIV